MKLIDDKLGGTTPLDVIVKFPNQEKIEKAGGTVEIIEV